MDATRPFRPRASTHQDDRIAHHDARTGDGRRGDLPAFSYLRPIEAGNEGLVDQMFASWNALVPGSDGVKAIAKVG